MDLFRRRVKVLLLSFVLLWLLLVARLAQIQIGGHHRFELERYTGAGGDRLLDTVRGGIYGYWGTPLAVQVPSFDVGVHYSQLLTSCSEPWEQADVRALIDEYMAATSPARAPAGRQERDYRALWTRRDAAAAPYGGVASYVRRRLAGESKRRIARGDPPASRQTDWRPVVARLTGRSIEELTAAADDVVTRVERVEALVRRRQMEREGKANIRIAERYQWHVVAEDVPGDVAAVIRTEAERFPSVEVGRRPVPAVRMIAGSRRRYSSGRLAPHVVGRVAPIYAERWAELDEQGLTWRVGLPLEEAGRRYTLADRTGVLGVEKAAEEDLRGRRGYVRNRLEFGYLSYETVSKEVPPERGHDVYLTIHEDLQSAANDALAWAARTPDLDFSAGSLVIVDVRSGAVLAAATWPSYDLADYRSSRRYDLLNADPNHPLLFRPTQAALPTGSVYKIITAIAALEEGAIRPETAFRCAHSEVFRAGGHSRTFTCVGRHGEITLVPAIEKSCNIYFYHTGLKAGGEALARWGRAFGLGMPTGVDLPYAKDGQLLQPKYTFGVLNLSIGQGDLLCTPLQVACAMAAVANGGKLYRPHFIARVCDASGEVVRATRPQFVPVPVKESTLNVVREGMRRVVETGTARRAGLDRFRAAGKTGTAERGKGRPNHAWFAGYAPYDDPKIAFAVVSENTSKHGGSGAAPILAHCLEEVWDAVEQMP